MRLQFASHGKNWKISSMYGEVIRGFYFLPIVNKVLLAQVILGVDLRKNYHNTSATFE